MNKKIVVFAFNGEMMCFVHSLLNTIDMHENGYDVKLVIEGSATKLIKELNNEKHQFLNLYRKVIDLGIFDCICRACSYQMGVYDEVEKQGLKYNEEMHGHPAMSEYIDKGYEIISL